MRRAHRVSYELFVGEIPDLCVVDHVCQNTICVNPEHLEAVSQRENVLRGRVPTPLRCRKGHEFSDDNVYLRKDGYRECMVCRRSRWSVGK